ncbi:MAG: prepilin-type N-terminal cleavage/methylation domain-containing protein [Microcystis sp. LE18-22.4A]|jgi:prepilin-type N-terminal cleavage/methylation domain-containing protein|nr:prepilin-type N-terminal cleavage/methylation domain-containing protein [Microcystis sp. LE18-22.4A]
MGKMKYKSNQDERPVKKIGRRQTGVKTGQSGYSFIELLVTLTLITILLLIGFSILSRLIAELRLDMATFELSQHWKFTRFDAMGSGTTPTTLCMKDDGRIEVAKIAGDDCETVSEWQSLTNGVDIDTTNSTLRRVSGVGGNDGTIYRVSWADTKGGMGGSWGQLGRLTLTAQGTTAKRCLFLFRVDGSWDIREDNRCWK